MDTLVKLSQVVFYLTAAIVAVLTFIKAKNGLLNSVNTEYQKRVMDRLSLLSDELYSEFDSDSKNYWAKDNPIKEVLDKFHKEIKEHKYEIIMEKKLFVGTPSPETLRKQDAYLDKLKSDPFIPKEIRTEIVKNLDIRSKTMFNAYMEVMEEYRNGLKEGKYWDTLDTNFAWIHNHINDKMYENGVGISQLEEKIHEIRLAIQSYLESFDPIKK